MNLNTLLLRAAELGASDVHLKLAQPPAIRVDGTLRYVEDWPPLSDEDLEYVLEVVTEATPRHRAIFHDCGDLDISYFAPGLPRFRVNGFRQRGSVSFAFRVIPTQIPSFEELGLPAGVERLADEQRGLVLVTGATGAGKTTTMATMLDHVNRTRRQHVVTIEDPIEVLHDDHGCIVNQREVGLDTESFEQALRHVLRQDPDVILIGELRDTESAQVALQAAQSGHFVLSTMHTIDAAETIGRFVELFPGSKHDQTRAVLGGVLRGVVSQRLVPRMGGGRVPAVEVMAVNSRIAELIRDNRADEIPDAIDDGAYHGMQTIQTALVQLVIADLVERQDAVAAANNRHDFEIALDRAVKAMRRTELLEAEAAEEGRQLRQPQPQPQQDATPPPTLRPAPSQL